MPIIGVIDEITMAMMVRHARGGGAVKLKYGSAPVWICDAALRPEVGSMARDSLLL